MRSNEGAGVDEIAAFLSKLKLQQYTAKLKDQGAETLEDLKELNDEETDELAGQDGVGMKMLHKKKFLKACKALREEANRPQLTELEHTQYDRFLEDCKCGKYKEALIDSGLNTISMLKTMSQNEINVLLTESNVALLHKKKFIKLAVQYQNGEYVFDKAEVEEKEEEKPKKSFYEEMDEQIGDMDKETAKKRMKAEMEAVNQFRGAFFGNAQNIIGKHMNAFDQNAAKQNAQHEQFKAQHGLNNMGMGGMGMMNGMGMPNNMGGMGNMGSMGGMPGMGGMGGIGGMGGMNMGGFMNDAFGMMNNPQMDDAMMKMADTNIDTYYAMKEAKNKKTNGQ